MIDGFIALYRCNMDVGLYLLGRPDVNELALGAVLECLFECLEDMLKYSAVITIVT